VGVQAATFVPEIANAVPHLRLTWDAAALGFSPEDVVRRLKEGEPRIEIKGAIAGGVEVGVWMLQPGEEEVVGRRLRDVLKKA
jgi:L-seryl-tRNA(Ser) seleniumtransferase